LYGEFEKECYDIENEIYNLKGTIIYAKKDCVK